MIARFAKIVIPAFLLTFLNIKPAQADTITFNNQPYVFFGNVCVVTDADGCTAQITANLADGLTTVTVTMGSDGVDPFDPFGFGFNVRSAISFANAGDTTILSLGAGWTNLTIDDVDLGNSWVLPAAQTNSVGDFIFSQPFLDSFPNSPNGGVYLTFSDVNGNVTDWILFANTAPGGNGEVLFFSEPNSPVPEPATTFLVGAGLIGAWFITRKRKA